METKKDDKKVTLNLSPSSMNLFYKSPLLFYLTYIAKVPDDTPVPVCYSLSGNIIHRCLELYAKRELTQDEIYMRLFKEWEDNGLKVHLDAKGNPLDSSEYLSALINGIQIIDKHECHLCEEMISFPLAETQSMKIGIKGIIDLQAKEKGKDQAVIIDYKTSNRVDEGKDFERQALFYNLLIYKKKNFIPSKTIFHYLKLGVTKEYSFSKEDIENFEKELHSLTEEILNLGTDIGNYPLGDIGGMFNSKRKACFKELKRRKQTKLFN